MKKLLFLLVFVPAFVIGQSNQTTRYSNTTSNYDLSEWHDQGTLWDRTDDNFTLLYNTPVLGAYFSDSAVTVALDSAEWEYATNASYNLWSGKASGYSAAITGSGDSITIAEDGDYYAIVNISLSAAADDSIQVAVFKNDAAESQKAEVMTIGTEVVNVSLPVMLFGLNVGDDISIRVRNVADGDDVKLIHGSTMMFMLRPD